VSIFTQNTWINTHRQTFAKRGRSWSVRVDRTCDLGLRTQTGNDNYV
jgi:hypothetical protein